MGGNLKCLGGSFTVFAVYAYAKIMLHNRKNASDGMNYKNTRLRPNKKLGHGMIVYAPAPYRLLRMTSLFATASWRLPLPRPSVTFFALNVSTATQVTMKSSLANYGEHILHNI